MDWLQQGEKWQNTAVSGPGQSQGQGIPDTSGCKVLQTCLFLSTVTFATVITNVTKVRDRCILTKFNPTFERKKRIFF